VDNVGQTAFELALTRAHDKGLTPLVTSVDKANVLEPSRFWRKHITHLHQAVYPEVELEHVYVDDMEHQINANPQRFNVIVTENGYGDILSEAGATLTGAIGLLASASINRRGQGIFEPPHGSAPDIAGQNKANPLGMIGSMALMLEHLGMPDEARAIQDAIDRTLSRRLFHRRILTRDLGGHAGTLEMGRAVLKNLKV
jgi:3-isopropylmalate dehydrogenase